MRGKLVVTTILLGLSMLMVGCTGNIEIPGSGKPAYGMHGLETAKAAPGSYNVSYNVFNLNPNSNADQKPYQYLAFLEGDNVLYSEYNRVDNVGSTLGTGENNLTVSLQELVDWSDSYSSTDQLCGKSVTLYTVINPEADHIPSGDSVDVDHIEESSSVNITDGAGVKEYRNSITINCDSETLVQPDDTFRLQDFPVNRENGQQRNNYVNPEDVGVHDILKHNGNWYVTLMGVANAPNNPNYDSTWLHKVNTYNTDWEHVEGPRRLPPTSQRQGGQELALNPDGSDSGPVGVKAWDTLLYYNEEIDETLNQESFNVGKMYDVAYASNGRKVIADRGSNADDALLHLYGNDGDKLTTEDLDQTAIGEEADEYIFTVTRMDDEGKWLVGTWSGPPGRFYVFNNNLNYEGKVQLGGQSPTTGSVFYDEDTDQLYVGDYTGRTIDVYDKQSILSEVTQD